jgi:hypothetical protein
MTSTLDPDNLSNRAPARPKGHDIRTLGPSDSSDSGSDMATSATADPDLMDAERGGDVGRDDDSDRFGTGEHLTAGREPNLRVAGDIEVDRVIGPGEAGLGDGLDQAEEAQFGVTDEIIKGDFEEEREPVVEKPAKPARGRRKKT